MIPVGERYLLWKKGTKAGLALIYLLLSNLLIWKNRLEQLLNRHKLRVTREATQKQGVRHIFNTSVHTEAVVVALPCLLAPPSLHYFKPSFAKANAEFGTSLTGSKLLYKTQNPQRARGSPLKRSNKATPPLPLQELQKAPAQTPTPLTVT